MKIAATNKLYDVDGETIVNKVYVGSDLVWLAAPLTSGTYYPGVSADDGYTAMASLHNGDTSILIGMQSWSTMVFIRFVNVNIPQGATIVSATLKLTAFDNYSVDTTNVTCQFENSDNPGTILSGDNMIDRYSLRTDAIAWNNVEHWTKDGEYATPELKTILQPVVDREEFAGNAVLAFINDPHTSTSYSCIRTFISWDGAQILHYGRPKLYVEWG